MARQSRGIRRRPALAAISIGGLFWASHVAFLPSPAQPVRGGVAATMGLFASVAGQLSARAQGAEGGDGGLQVEFSTLEEAQAAAAALRAKSGDFTGLLLDQPVNLVEPDLPKPDSAAEFTVKVFTEVFESGNIGAIPQAIGYSIGEFQDAFGQSVEEGTLPWDQIGLVFLVFVVLANSTTVIFPFLEEALAPDEAPVTSYPTRVAK
ncbi:unnamed protein product, partial [Polarella glacialis]